MHDPEHGAAALRAQTPLGLRYHYLSGGANTGLGWQTFAGGNGAFVGEYVADAQAQGFLSAFSYYMLLQSAPGNAQRDERLQTTVNLGSRPTMTAYFQDLRTFFVRAAATGVDPIVLHVEPDAWGYAQRSAPGDDARLVPAHVAATGLPELAGLPDDVAGFAQAVVRLRDRYAPNVRLGYHVSVWGTGVDISHSDPPDEEVDALAARSVAFYRSLRASFDLLFFEFADRDAGYREHVDGEGRLGWWDADDFLRNVRYVGRITSALARPGVMWQIPLGNTRMRAMNNTYGHYQDNRVETLLDPSRAVMTRYRDAGIVAFLFGNAVAGTTCACDAVGDGITNPAPVNGNVGLSLSADDDGGLFKALVAQYAARPGLRATSAANAAPPSTWARFMVRATTTRRGRVVRVRARVTSTTAATATVVVEVRRPGAKVRRAARKQWSSRQFKRRAARPFTLDWRPPAGTRAGRYGVVVRVIERRGRATRLTARRATSIVLPR
ncbi:MAG: hypothetical protein Q8O56_03400 [Solirubrobacteraceae bacterium]|nr:hypothetical protein [Solirubrobacteraceae bacterium]